MKVVDAVKSGFDAANANLKLVAVIFIFNLIWNIAVIPFTPEAPLTDAADVALPAGLMVISIIFMFASIFIQGGLLGSVRDYVKEKKSDLAAFTQYGAKFYLRLLGLALVIVAVMGLIALVVTLLLAPSVASGNAALIAFATIGAFIISLGAIYLMILLFFAPYMLVLEDKGIVEAIKGSIAFAKKLILKILGLLGLLTLMGIGIGFIMGMIAGALAIPLPGKVTQVITAILSGGVNAYLGVLVASTIVIFYLALKGDVKEAAA